MPGLYFFYFFIQKPFVLQKRIHRVRKKAVCQCFHLTNGPSFILLPFRFCYSSCKRASSSGSNSQLFKFLADTHGTKLGPHIITVFPVQMVSGLVVFQSPLGVESQVELVFPTEFVTGFAQGIVPNRGTGWPLAISAACAAIL